MTSLLVGIDATADRQKAADSVMSFVSLVSVAAVSVVGLILAVLLVIPV